MFESFVKSISYKTQRTGSSSTLWFESFVKSISYKTETATAVQVIKFESFVKSISYKTLWADCTTCECLRALLNQWVTKHEIPIEVPNACLRALLNQ